MMPEIRPFSGAEHQPFSLGQGSPGLLLIHGFPGTAAELRLVGEGLANQGWHTRGLLLPGFGSEIANINKYTGRDWLAACQQEWEGMAAQHPGPRALLGYSMGGALALNLAPVLKPDYLILVAPFWRADGFLPRLVPLAKWFMPRMQPFKNANFSDPRFRESVLRIMPHLDLDSPDVQSYIRNEFTLPLNALHEILKLGKRAYQAASKVATPTLVIQARGDNTVSPKNTQKLAARLRGRVKYVEVEADHDLMHHPEPCAQITKQIIEFTAQAAVPGG